MDFFNVKQISKVWSIPESKVTRLARAGKILGAKKQGNSWLIPANATLPADGRSKKDDRVECSSSIRVTENLSFTPIGAQQKVCLAFKNKYGKKPKGVMFIPYRICPLGAHVDHNLGKIAGFAIDKGIHMAYAEKQNGVIEIASLQFPKRAQWHILSTPVTKQNDWADPLRGATIALAKRYPLRIGMSAVIDGELPIGGLSSSAAVIITFLSVLCKLNGVKLTEKELVLIAQEAENKYVGVSCGKMDQSCEIYCRKDKLLYLDNKNDSYSLIDFPSGEKTFTFMILFSGVERSLAGSKFNMRVDEARSAAYALMAFSGLEYGKFEDACLRDVPFEIYEKYKHKLPENWRKRAEHFYTENQRVEQGVLAWAKGDIETFGKLVFESGKSSIENWETGSNELITLYEIMEKTEGVYGGRFSGAGFKGCCMAIVDTKQVDQIAQKITKEYLHVFPHLAGKFSVHICESSDGVKL